MAGSDRKTVHRYVEAAQKAGFTRKGDTPLDDVLITQVVDALLPGAPSSVGAMREHLRAHEEAIRGWAKEGCRDPKLAKLVRRTTGVPVPLRTVQRFVAEDLGLKQGQGDTVRIGVSIVHRRFT